MESADRYTHVVRSCHTRSVPEKRENEGVRTSCYIRRWLY